MISVKEGLCSLVADDCRSSSWKVAETYSRRIWPIGDIAVQALAPRRATWMG